MNTTRYPNTKRKQRWLSAERVQQKFADLRAVLQGRNSTPILVQAEFALSCDRSGRLRRQRA